MDLTFIIIFRVNIMMQEEGIVSGNGLKRMIVTPYAK